MSIHEHLPKPMRRELKQVGWSKAVELVKVARRYQERFESATWLHKPAALRCGISQYSLSLSMPQRVVHALKLAIFFEQLFSPHLVIYFVKNCFSERTDSDDRS
jgi:hypothetical protein